MALLSFDEEHDRAEPGWPFATGYEFDSWQAIWCHECDNRDGCPLLAVALLERVPQPWREREPQGLNRYTCREYVPQKSEDPTGELPMARGDVEAV